MKKLNQVRVGVVDFFSGCGGTSAGFKKAGFALLSAIDFDEASAATYQHNFPGTFFLKKDIQKVRTKTLEPVLASSKYDYLLFSACAPCQPFTKQRRAAKKNDDRRPLLLELRRFIRYYRPDFIFLENVPGLQSADVDGPLPTFLEFLKRQGYTCTISIIESQDYGVPQRRRRLVVLASLHGQIAIPRPTHGPKTKNKFSKTWSWIKHFPKIAAGEESLSFPNHRAASLSAQNLVRIKATPFFRGRESWPKRLGLICHRSHVGHTDVYGRMHPFRPASALTTRCISLSNGRYGHPYQHRAISVREAAALQTFSDDFRFYGNLNDMARQVGNAVPVLLATTFAKQIRRHARAIPRG